MASSVSESKTDPPLTRSKSRSQVLIEPTPRGPLKRTRKGLVNRAPAAAVNGSRDVENGPEDEEPPDKKIQLEAGGDVDGSGDENEMDVQEPVQEPVQDQEKNEDQEMESCPVDLVQDSSRGTCQPKICQGPHGDMNLFPRVVLGQRCLSGSVENEVVKRVKQSTKGPVVSTRSAGQIRSPVTRHDVPASKTTSMDEYRRTMEAKAKSIRSPPVNHHVPARYPISEKSYTTRQRANNIPAHKVTPQLQKQEREKTVNKKSSDHSSRGFMGFFCRLMLVLLLLLLSVSFTLLAYKIIPVLKKTADVGELPPRAVEPEKFADHLSLLETQFPSQRSELWRRSKIHLEKHLNTAQPTEPVSLILTAGLRAEKTMHCLAQGLASSFSSALNASILHIDGASKASQDSDEVKLDMDSQLQAAFEGDKPVAVIHRFEELPPGSTLIFYRYCDHANAAYKRVFLLFTVLLPEDDISVTLSMKEVEEMVQDHVKEKLVGSSSQTAFNKMDIDKFSGLWSRVAHLILPVVPEKELELKGC